LRIKPKGQSGHISRGLTEPVDLRSSVVDSDPIEGCDHEVARSDFEESSDGDLLDR